MASNIKWYKRALRALDSGRLDVWERIKNKLPEERRNYLESTFKLNASPVVLTEPELKNTIKQEVVVKPVLTKKTKPKPKATKKKTTSKKTTSTRKKKTTSKEK